MIELPDHPWFSNDVMTPDPELLDTLAANESGSVERLLFGRVPLKLFGDALTAELDAYPVAGALWVMHLSGYFGGVWLRREIARALPDAPLVGVDITPDAAVFEELTSAQADALAALEGDDERALGYAAAQAAPQLDGYGYNHGYLVEILEAPPAGLTAPPGFFTAPGILDATYAVDEIAGLDDLRRRFTAELPKLDVPSLTTQQAEAHERGRSVWSTGLSVQGFPQAEYEQLLELSAYFLQGTQAAAIAAILAAADRDASLARRGALVAALLAPWTISYRMGLLDGRADRALPTFS